MATIPTIDRIKDTTIMRMIRKLAGVTDEAIGKNAESMEQTFDEENRILATTLKTVDGTEISGSVYVPGGGDGGDIVVDTINYSESVPDVFNYIRAKYAEGTYNCNINIKADLLDGTKEGDNKISFNATQFTVSHLNLPDDEDIIYQIEFQGAGESALNGTAKWLILSYTPANTGDYKYGATVTIYSYESDKDAYVNQGWYINKDVGLTLKGFVIKGIKGAAITPYTASTGIKIDDENSTIAVDTDVIATVDSVKEVDTKADTANINALKAYKSAYVENNTMTFEKGNGDTDTIALPTGGSYTAGDGITISDNEIAVDTSVIATTAVTTELASGISTNRNLINGTFDDVNISGSHLVFDKVNGEQKEIEIPTSGGATLNETVIYTPIVTNLSIDNIAKTYTTKTYATIGKLTIPTLIGEITTYGFINTGSSSEVTYYLSDNYISGNTISDYIDNLIQIKSNVSVGTLVITAALIANISATTKSIEFPASPNTTNFYYDFSTKTWSLSSFRAYNATGKINSLMVNITAIGYSQ